MLSEDFVDDLSQSSLRQRRVYVELPKSLTTARTTAQRTFAQDHARSKSN
jgi:hypothetical protein